MDLYLYWIRRRTLKAWKAQREGQRKQNSTIGSIKDSPPPNAAPAGDAAAVEEDLRHAFRVFDTDGNGAISPSELARVLRGLGEAATVAQCRRMIEGVDRNGDGLVSFDEFKLMMAAGGGFGLGRISSS